MCCRPCLGVPERVWSKNELLAHQDTTCVGVLPSMSDGVYCNEPGSEDLCKIHWLLEAEHNTGSFENSGRGNACVFEVRIDERPSMWSSRRS